MKNTQFVLGTVGVLLSASLLAAPAKPVIDWMPAQLSDGSNTSVQWNMWWGENGTDWTLASNAAPCARATWFPTAPTLKVVTVPSISPPEATNSS